MSTFREIVTGASSTLLHFAPVLVPNVIATCAASLLIGWTGFNVATLIKPAFDLPGERPVRSFVDAVLISYMCGALYALFLMYTLGFAGWYKPGVLWAAMILPCAVRGRKAFQFQIPRPPALRILPLILLGAGPLLISLTNPMPSWMDVLEGNVAPIQRLITFSAYDAQTALPSALYPTNRATPLYTAFFGLSARLFGLEAHEVLAASLFATLLLLVLAAGRLGSVLLPNNRHASWLAALCLVLGHNYAELQSARSTVWVMIFALIALAKAVEVLHNPDNSRLLIECAIATAATVLAHPLEGGFTTLAVLLIVGAAWVITRPRSLRLISMAGFVGIAAGAPLIWSWWPQSRAGLVGGMLLLFSLPFVIRSSFARTSAAVGRTETRVPRSMILVPLFIVVSAALLHWNFYGSPRRSFLVEAFIRYPVPVCLTIALMLLALRGRAQAASIVAGSVLAAASIPLWILPYVTLTQVERASFNYEIPLKGMYYWMSGFFAICGSVVLAQIWERSTASIRRHAVVYRAFVLSVVILPIGELVGLKPGRAETGLYGTLSSQARLVVNGYWAGWGNSRWIVSDDDRELFDFLTAQVEGGHLLLDDRIAHVARASNLTAVPFPAFTGIAQDLYLPVVDTMHIHTHGGRLYDIRRRLPPPGWVLIERSMLPFYSVEPASVRYENDRVVLAHTLSDADVSIPSL